MPKGAVQTRPKTWNAPVVRWRRIERSTISPSARQLAGCRRAQPYFVRFRRNACDGYSLEFRQVCISSISGEDSRSTNDQRSTTWEDAGAKSFKFTWRFHQRQADRCGRRPRPARRSRDRGRSDKAGAEDPRRRRQGGVPDQAHGARIRGGARRQDHRFQSMTAPTPATRFSTRSTVIGRKIAAGELPATTPPPTSRSSPVWRAGR